MNFKEGSTKTRTLSARKTLADVQIISSLKRFPHQHGYVFVCIHRFPEIPLHFSEILFAIQHEGRRVIDWENIRRPTADGSYCLTGHPRGKNYGNNTKDSVRYVHACNIEYSTVNGIKISKIKWRHPAFIKCLNTAPQITRIEFQMNKDETTLDFAKTRVAKRVLKNWYR